MWGRDHPRAVGGRLGLLGVGGFLLWVLYRHGVGGGHGLDEHLVGAVLPLTFVVLFVAASQYLVRTGTAEAAPRLLGWSVAGVVVMGVLDGLALVHQSAEGAPMTDPYSLSALFLSAGALVGLVVGAHDARRHELAVELRAERDRAERLNQQLAVLSRVLRHDLRNGLNAIHGYAELLASPRRTAGRRVDPTTQAEIIRDRSEELLEIGERARVVERFAAGETPATVREPVDLVALVDRRLEALVERHPFVAIESSLPGSVAVEAVPLLQVAVDNLLENAVVHNDADVPTVAVDVAADEETVACTVVDDGPGIPDAEVAVLTDGETPLDHSDGVGLWLVNWIVEESGGSVELDTDDAGTAVTVRLRRAAEENAAVVDAERGDTGTAGDATDRADARRLGSVATNGERSGASPGSGTGTGSGIPTRAASANDDASGESVDRTEHRQDLVEWLDADAPPGGPERREEPAPDDGDGTVWDDLFEDTG